jgi:hypothetical protein
MAVLDTAIQEKAKHFNVALDGRARADGRPVRSACDYFQRHSRNRFSDCRASISKLAHVERWIPDKTREARLSGMTP